MRDPYACVRWVLWMRLGGIEYYIHKNGEESTTSLRHAKRYGSEAEALLEQSLCSSRGSARADPRWVPVRLAPVIDLHAREVVA